MQGSGNGFMQAAGLLGFWLNVLLTYLSLPYLKSWTYPWVYRFTVNTYGYDLWIVQHLDWLWTGLLAFLVYALLSFLFSFLITLGGMKLARFLLANVMKD